MRGDPIADCRADCRTDMDANRITVCESVCTSDVVTDRHTNDWPITCADCVTYGITYGCTFCVSYSITDNSTQTDFRDKESKDANEKCPGTAAGRQWKQQPTRRNRRRL